VRLTDVDCAALAPGPLIRLVGALVFEEGEVTPRGSDRPAWALARVEDARHGPAVPGRFVLRLDDSSPA
jgi:hypothetical protein